MECPHCYGDMYYTANDNWHCDDCTANVIGMAYPGLHYFSDGRVHKIVNNKCQRLVTI